MPEEMSLRERLEKDREERIQQARLNRIQTNATTGAQPLNPKRREEASRQFREMLAPPMPDFVKPPQDLPVLDTVEFYCYDTDGDLATIRLYADGGSSKVDS